MSIQRLLRFTWAAIALIAAGMLALGWWLCARDRLLLPTSTRVGPESWSGQWISDQETATVEYPDDFKHSPVMKHTDIRTGVVAERIIEAASRDSHSEVAISPDGEWALCWDTTRSEFGVNAVHLKTGWRRHWSLDGDAYHYPLLWMPDGRRWLSTTNVPSGYLTIYNIVD